jgi:hypothetical protein
MWFLPVALIIFTLAVAIPLSKYIAWEISARGIFPLVRISPRYWTDELEAVHGGAAYL